MLFQDYQPACSQPLRTTNPGRLVEEAGRYHGSTIPVRRSHPRPGSVLR